MNMPKKFKLNTEDFKVYYDDVKKTHVCESLDTGEKTNIGVLGLFLQMGILKTVEGDEKATEEIPTLKQRLDDLESKLGGVLKDSGKKEPEKKEELVKEIEEEKKPKSDIKKHIIEKVLEQAVDEDFEEEKPKKKVKEEEKEVEEEVTEESDEEVDNWMDI